MLLARHACTQTHTLTHVIYKPWILGVFHKYMTQVRASLMLINPSPESEGRGI